MSQRWKDAAQPPQKYQHREIEDKWSSAWEEDNTYRYDPTVSRQDTFVVDTPPPTVSGSLHLGHIFSYTHTDLIVRYQRMLGKNICYPMGWDDNGLPTERRVQNVFGVQCDINVQQNPEFQPRRDKGKKDPIEHISRPQFIKLCQELTAEDELAFRDLFLRLGLSVDWSLEYATIDDHCRSISQASFLDLYKKGLAYLRHAPTLWDVSFQTAVAQAEVEDREQTGHYHDIRFYVEGEAEEEFVISTTRPELLPACIAVVAHPDDKRYNHLFGKTALTPLFGAKVPILPAQHADPEKGRGILMVCTFGDTMDIEWWKQGQLPLKQIIGSDGKLKKIDFTADPFQTVHHKVAQQNYAQLENLKVHVARKKIVELLMAPDSIDPSGKKRAALVGEKRPTQRMVKFYEKGDRPLEFLTSRQWFIKILDYKSQLLELGEKITWRPDFMKTRYLNWVEGLNQDWCISRQRYFGVPFPLWYPIKTNGEIDYQNPILPELSQLPVDPMSETAPGYKEEQRNLPGGFVGEKDVMDTWATSSMSPQIVSHWSQDQERHQKLFPMDLRPQSHEIIRTWAFYTIVKAFHHQNDLPWHNVAISGWILDPDRKKMSKSKGNVVTPMKYLDQFGGDAVRYWAARARLGVDTAFDENLFKMGRKLANKLFNASKFTLGILDPNSSPKELDFLKVTQPIDQAFLSRLSTTVAEATLAFEQFNYAQALQKTEECFWFFCDHYLELVKTRAYNKEDQGPQLSAQITLDASILTFLKLFAPFFPYLTEEIWSWRYALLTSGPIHRASWPVVENLGQLAPLTFDPLSYACKILSEVRAKKAQQKKKLKWPLSKLVVTGKKDCFQAAQLDLKNSTCALNDLIHSESNPKEALVVEIELADEST